MPLFKVNSGELISIKSQDVKLERDIQRLIEANLESVFGLHFISTEFPLNNLRVDTLAYDPVNKCFVVIEYKRDRSSSVVDQGYSYLSLVLINKADCVLEYNEKTNTSTSKSHFDWAATRVIFVASRFTPHQLGAINFRDLPIELWEARLYENDILSLEQKTADNQAVSIKTITKKTDASDNDDLVKKEIKTYTTEDLFPQKKEQQRAIFEELDDGIKAMDDAITQTPKKVYIGYRIGSDWRMFVALNPRADGVRVDLTRSQPKDFSDPEKMVTYDKKSMQNYHSHVSNILVASSDQVEYALSIIRQAYKRHIKEFGQ